MFNLFVIVVFCLFVIVVFSLFLCALFYVPVEILFSFWETPVGEVFQSKTVYDFNINLNRFYYE